jgi:DNA modification methylase
MSPLGGSGSTMMAADQLDRVCYCMELDPKYVDVIVKRWEEHSGLNAQTIK